MSALLEEKGEKERKEKRKERKKRKEKKATTKQGNKGCRRHESGGC